MEASSSATEIIFRISDGSNQSENDVRITQPDRLRRWSLGLRRLMEEATSKQILLKVDPKSGFDSAAAAWVLEKLQRQGLDVRPDPETLARHCAVLWKYECIPDLFKTLGDSLQRRTSSGSPSIDQQSTIAPSASPSGNSRCWQGKKNNTTCGQLITIAIVLGLQEVLEEEIKIAVWGTNKKVKVAVPPQKDINIDIEVIRKNELGKLFNSVFYKIFDIYDDNEKLAESIRETLKQHNLGNFSKRWIKNAEELEQAKWTPYDFLRGMENALAPEPQTQGHDARAQARARARARDVPDVNWLNLFSRTTKTVKRTLHVIDSKEIGGDDEVKGGILDSLEEFIQERQHALAAELMSQKDLIVQGWKVELERLDDSDQHTQT